jgi:carboxypeptidase Taq
MMTAYEAFQRHLAEINDLCCVINVLQWDTRTQMPPGSAEARGRHVATITRLAQERLVSDDTGRLLDAAQGELAGTDPDGYPARALAQTREAYQVARRVPPGLMEDIAELKMVAQQVWVEARAANDYPRFAPYLTKTVELNRRLAEAIRYEGHPYDALLGRYEPGLTAARLADIFAGLKSAILPLLGRAARQSRNVRADFLDLDYPQEQQRAFALEVITSFGYDLRRGRVDSSPHPFEISFTRDDVRITTRYNPRHPARALFGLFHETGHALYEQGVDPALTRSALTTDLLDLYAVGGSSYGTHESQSRLWENLVGRSRPFWQRHFARLQDFFPEQLANVDAEAWYRAVNRVQPGPIRVEADEVSYNLHIMLRVEIEMALLDGKVPVGELPELWNAKMQEYLGVLPPSDADGVLQDIHWSTGYIGSFPTYTVGNIMASQFMAAARLQDPGLDASLAAGDYGPLRAWLTANVYRHGRSFSPGELLQRTTGSPLSIDAYVKYLTTKYGDLFPA